MISPEYPLHDRTVMVSHCGRICIAVLTRGPAAMRRRRYTRAARRFDNSISFGLGKLHGVGLIALGSRLMVLRKERTLGTCNRIGNSLVHAGSMLRVTP